MSAMYTQVDGTGNHSKVLDAQSTLVERALPAISAAVRSHPCKSMQPLYGSFMYLLQRQGWEVHHSLTQKRGSTQKLLCGADSTRSPAHRRDSAHTPPSDSHWPRISRAHQGIEAVAAAASSLTYADTPLRPSILCAMQEAQRPASHRKLRPRPLWVGAAAYRGVQCAGTGTGTGTRKRIEGGRSRIHSSVSHILRKCNVMPDGKDAGRWLWNHEEQLLNGQMAAVGLYFRHLLGNGRQTDFSRVSALHAAPHIFFSV